MGRVYLEHFGGEKLFSCAQCDTFLTNRKQLISTRFTGATGRAYLFNKVVNLNYRYANTSFIGKLDTLVVNDRGFPISTSFLFLPPSMFWSVLIFSEPSERIMLTGRHWVRDVSCKRCNYKLGWMYELAAEDEQTYKEGKVILEKALVREKDGLPEMEVVD